MLADADLLTLWDRCQGQPPAARALELLAAAEPGADPAVLPAGGRDAALLRLHARAFGGRLDGVTTCPACAERLDVAVDAADLAAATDPGGADGAPPAAAEPGGAAADPPAPANPGGGSGAPPGGRAGAGLVVRAGGFQVRFRVPTAADLAALPRDGAALLARCVLGATRIADGVAVDPAGLPAAVRAAVEEAMEAADPGAELTLALVCPACGHGWSEPLDPVAFVSAAVDAHALLVAADVHVLARAYGWGEAEILALSPARRRLYLEVADR